MWKQYTYTLHTQETKTLCNGLELDWCILPDLMEGWGGGSEGEENMGCIWS